MGVQRVNRGDFQGPGERRPGRSAVMLVSTSPGDAEQQSQSLKQHRYDVSITTSLAGMETVIQSGKKVALVVIDLAGLGRVVWKHCERLQAASIPFLVITDQRSPSLQTESLLHGARGVFTGPLAGRELAEYVRATLGR